MFKYVKAMLTSVFTPSEVHAEGGYSGGLRGRSGICLHHLTVPLPLGRYITRLYGLRAYGGFAEIPNGGCYKH